MCGLPPFDFGLKTLGQAEIHKNGVHVFNVHDVCAVFQVVAHIDLPYAGHAIERRNDFQARGGRASKKQFGLRDLQIGCAFIQRALADKTLCHQLLVAFLVGLRNRHFSQRLLNLRLLQLVIKLHQHLSGFHALAIGKVQLRNSPGNFRAHHHAAP